MAISTTKGTVVFRKWKESEGLDESRVGFSTLEELFELCLKADDQPIVDRVVVEGLDEKGTRRILVLGFQSVTRLNE